MTFHDTDRPGTAQGTAGKRRPGRPKGTGKPKNEQRPLTERELGILEGMAASGATDGMIRKRLNIRGPWWQWLHKHDRAAMDTLHEARHEADSMLVRALYRCALTAKGSVRRNSQALKAAALYARVRGLVKPDNVNVAVNNAPTGVLLVHMPVTAMQGDVDAIAELEASVKARQDALQRTAPLVQLPGPKYALTIDEDGAPVPPPLGRDNPIQDADFEILPNDPTPRAENRPPRKRNSKPQQ